MAGKISELTAASSVADADQIELLQGGTNKRATAAMVRAGLVSSSAVQSANTVFAGPTTGAAAAPTFRTLVTADLPTVPYTKGGTGLTALGSALQVLRVNSGGTALEFADPAGGGTIDGSGTADYVARWTDANTLAAAALRDNGTRAAVGDAPSSTASFTVKAQTGDNYCLAIYGTGGVIVPTVLLKHSSDVNGVTIKGDDTGFQFANGGEGTTLYVVPGYPEAYVKTHGSSAGRLNFQSHDGGSYVTVFALKNGKAQLWDGTNLLDVGFGANDSETAGYRNVRVANA